MNNRNAEQSTYTKIVSMLSAGVVSNAVTHPFSTASHDAIINQRSYWMWVNFQKCYRGYLPTLFYGPVLNGQYFFLQDTMQTYFVPFSRQQLGMSAAISEVVSNQIVGGMYGLNSGPINAVQRQIWQTPGSTFISTAKYMYQIGGFSPFIKGLGMSASAGMVFSAVYQSVRTVVNNQVLTDANSNSVGGALPGNLAAAVIASGVSAPMYYVRALQQVSKPEDGQPAASSIIKKLKKEVLPKKGYLNKFSCLCSRIDLFPIAMRSAISVTIGQAVYDLVRHALTDAEKPEGLSAKQRS